MAVYTKLTNQQIEEFLTDYPVGTLVCATGILQGIDNTNYKIETTQGLYVLTIFESRINPDHLPYFLSFMDHLSQSGIICPAPIQTTYQQTIGRLAGKPATLFPFLDGRGVETADITPALCRELGELLGRMHLAGQAFQPRLDNPMGIAAWETRLLKTADKGLPFFEELCFLKNSWPTDLPRGAVHADLFPDNVFILDGHIHGVIDFYFSATDFLTYDLAIVLNAWCFTPDHVYDKEKGTSFLEGYQSVRSLSDIEKSNFQILARGAAMRFLASRLYDLTFHDPNALVTPKDPSEYIKKLEFHRDHKII